MFDVGVTCVCFVEVVANVVEHTTDIEKTILRLFKTQSHHLPEEGAALHKSIAIVHDVPSAVGCCEKLRRVQCENVISKDKCVCDQVVGDRVRALSESFCASRQIGTNSETSHELNKIKRSQDDEGSIWCAR